MSSSCCSSSDSSSSSSSSSSCSSGSSSSPHCRKAPKRVANLYKECAQCTTLCAKLTSDGCRCNKRNCNGCNRSRHKDCKDDEIRGGNGTCEIKLCYDPEIQAAMLKFNVRYEKLNGGKVIGVEIRGPVQKCRHQAPVVLSLSGIYQGSVGPSRKLDSYVVGITEITAEEADELLNGKWYVTVRTEKFSDCEGEIRGKIKPQKLYKHCEDRGYGKNCYWALGHNFGAKCDRVKFCKDKKHCGDSSSSSSSSSSSC